MAGSIPTRYAPFIYGILQSAVTTGVATGIATQQLLGFGMEFAQRWLYVWAIAWLTMLPVVLLVAPLLQRAVVALTGPPAVPSTDNVKRRPPPSRS